MSFFLRTPRRRVGADDHPLRRSEAWKRALTVAAAVGVALSSASDVSAQSAPTAPPTITLPADLFGNAALPALPIAATSDAPSPAADRPQTPSDGAAHAPAHVDATGVDNSNTGADSDANEGVPPAATANTAAADALRVRPSTAQEREALQAEIERILRSPTVRGHVIGARIVALSSGQVVYEKNPETGYKPASNTKVFSTAAAFGVLGPQWRTESRIVAEGPPVDGVIRGDVMLHGLFDLSWSTLFYPNTNYVANRLIDQLVENGVREIRGDVHIRGVFVYDGHRFGTLNTNAERLQVASAFQAQLRARGIRHGGNFQISASAPPSRFSTELADWKGPSLATIVAHINRLSHNEFADTLLLAVGRHAQNDATYASGFRSAVEWYRAQGIDTQNLQFHDGSGLSHNNRVNATQLTEVIHAVQRFAWADLWNHSLSVAGHDGTYGQRCVAKETVGAAWLKSGTIDGVITTSGILHHRGTGETYSVALLMNQVVHQPSARSILDQIVEALGAHRSQAARPNASILQRAELQDNEEILLEWTTSPRATTYVIEARDKDSAWTALEVTTATRLTLPRRAQLQAYRVRAINDDGISDPSGVLIGGGPRTAPQIVVVDGNDRWASPQFENGLRTQPWFLSEFLAPLTGYRVSSLNNDALNTLKPSGQTTVIFSLGEESRGTQSLSENERTFIRAQLRAGGRVIAAGSEIGWDLATNATDGPAFLDEVFGAAFLSDNAGNTAACMPTDRGAACGHFWTPGLMKIDMPDSFEATRGEVCMTYAGMSAAACVHYRHAAVVGFPLESIDNDADRTRILRELLEKVGTPRTSDRS